MYRENIISPDRWRSKIISIYRAFNKYPIIPVILLMPIVVCGIFGPLFYPHDPTSMNLSMALKPPSWMAGGDPSYLLGTDKLGRDVLSRLIEGARTSLIVSIFGVFIAGCIGITIGLLAGYFGRLFDNIVMRIVDTWMSIPAILFIILLSGATGGGITTIILCIGLVFWTAYARVIRGQTLSIREQEYVALARVTGCSTFRILMKHILPNTFNTIMVMGTLQLGSAIMIEASITFLGLGIQPPNTAWGLIVADGRSYMATAWWVPTFGGLAILITVMGANMIGDWLRDKLDPRLRQL
jgi:peptide/nickel transport system permease protein